MSRLLLLALLLLPLGGLADTVYRTTDAQGNAVFTDQPPANATQADKIEIRPTNTAPPPEIATPPAPEDSVDAGAEAASYSVTITEPANETTIAMGPGNFSVNAEVSPALAKDQKLQLFVDGTAREEPRQVPKWDLTNVFRGQHDLTVGVIDKSGETVALSAPVRVYVYRPSTNYKNRQPPPKPPKPQPK